jgi:hypothetical protein
VKNYGRNSCPNSPYIDLDYLLNIIQRHCEIHGKNWAIEYTKALIYKIEVGEELVIRWKDSSVTRIGKNSMQF